MKNFHRGTRDGNRPTTMHKATCSQCGKDCQLPFRPNGNRAVFCSTCFETQKNGDSVKSTRSFDKRKPSFEDKRMFEALCSNCGNNCLVPFRPIAGKPVFCNKCFDKGDNVVNKNFVVKSDNSGGKQMEQFKAQLEMLNIKLDRILREITQGPSFEEDEEDEEEMDAEEVVLKKMKAKVSKKTATKKKK